MGGKKERLGYMANTLINVHQSHAYGHLMGVAGGDGRLGCLCGKAGISHVVIHSSTHSSGCVVHPYKFLIASFFITKYGIGMGPMPAIVDLWDHDGKILLLLLVRHP